MDEEVDGGFLFDGGRITEEARGRKGTVTEEGKVREN
jgi:hypothetical protein